MNTEYSFDGLDDFDKALAEIIEKKYPKEFKQMIVNAAYMLEEKVKGLTPEDTGNLLLSWMVGKVIKSGDIYSIEVLTNVEYAPHVEHGHRAANGKFVKGAHMMEISLYEIEKQLPLYLKSWIDDFIENNKL